MQDDEWNVAAVNMFFTVEVANSIMKIPLARQGGEDCLIWSEVRDGILSVKSVYFVARSVLEKYMLDHDTRR